MEAYSSCFVIIAVLSLCSFMLLLAKLLTNGNFDEPGFPRGPPVRLPVIGHLHLLGKMPHKALAQLAKQYGPIFGLRLGSSLAVVISSPPLVREVLLTHDTVFANRPPLAFISSLFYGPASALVLGSYGPCWRKLRKICMVGLFTSKRLHELQFVQQQEMAVLLERLRQASAGGTIAVDIGKCVGNMITNVLCRMLFSRTLSSVSSKKDDITLQQFIKRAEQASVPTLGDFIPWLRWSDFLSKRRMKHLHAEIDRLLESILVEAEHDMQSMNPHDPPRDFLQVLLSYEANHSTTSQEVLTRVEIKNTIWDLLGAGIHTSTHTIEWAMAELLRNARCFTKLQEEVHVAIGKKTQVDISDLSKLPYLKMVVKEVLRLHPVLPLLSPRMSLQACTVGNYSLPPNTHVFLNIWAIGRDDEVWEKATTFFPERFEDKDVDVKGQHFELLPFGAGRRVCLGLPLALPTLEVILANLVNNFKWDLPEGETPLSMNMLEKVGFTLTKCTPVIAIPKPWY